MLKSPIASMFLFKQTFRHYIKNTHHPFINIYWNLYGISFVGIFMANTCTGIYRSTVLEKPFGINCPLRNFGSGMVEGTSYGFTKGVIYSFGHVLFWLNAGYEHYYSDILETRYGKMRAHDIRYHLVPNATHINEYISHGYYYWKERIYADSQIILFKKLGIVFE
jgi:hypothetical protein